jgi:hypothetical protein
MAWPTSVPHLQKYLLVGGRSIWHGQCVMKHMCYRTREPLRCREAPRVKLLRPSGLDRKQLAGLRWFAEMRLACRVVLRNHPINVRRASPIRPSQVMTMRIQACLLG